MTLGERILSRRTALRITQREIAEALGVTPQHISLIEQNKAAPSLALLAGLAKELGTTTDYLISGKEGQKTGTISAIKADDKLTLRTKKALITLVEESYIKYDDLTKLRK
jgi:transcriptional regulator with XRE-family HTH domain